jgi:hypothetical protein
MDFLAAQAAVRRQRAVRKTERMGSTRPVAHLRIVRQRRVGSVDGSFDGSVGRLLQRCPDQGDGVRP